MEPVNELAGFISQYGFPIVMAVGLGYFIYFIWKFIGEHIRNMIREHFRQLLGNYLKMSTNFSNNHWKRIRK